MGYILAIFVLLLGVYYLFKIKDVIIDKENDAAKNVSSTIISEVGLTGVLSQSGDVALKSGGTGKTGKSEQNDNSILAQLIRIVPNEHKDFSNSKIAHNISKDSRIPLGDISLLSADESYSLYKSLSECENFNTMSWEEMRDFRLNYPSLPAGFGKEFERRIKACESIDKKDYQQTYNLMLHAATEGSASAKIAYAHTNRVWVDDKYRKIRELETSTKKEDVELEAEIFSNKIMFLESLQMDDYHMGSLELGTLYAGHGKHQDRVRALMSYLIFFAETPNASNSERFISNFISDTMRPVDIQLAIDGANDYLANKYSTTKSER